MCSSDLQAYMHHIQTNAEEAVRNMLKALSKREGLTEVDTVEANDFLDDGSEIVLRLTIDRRDGSAIFDFSGTGPELWGNLNAPRAVTHSAILYSLRCLIDRSEEHTSELQSQAYLVCRLLLEKKKKNKEKKKKKKSQ